MKMSISELEYAKSGDNDIIFNSINSINAVAPIIPASFS